MFILITVSFVFFFSLFISFFKLKVDITVNNETVPFKMKLGAAGEAYFLHEKKVYLSIILLSFAYQKILLTENIIFFFQYYLF